MARKEVGEETGVGCGCGGFDKSEWYSVEVTDCNRYNVVLCLSATP